MTFLSAALPPVFCFFFLIFLTAVNWASWWTVSRDGIGSPLFPVQPCWGKKKNPNERKERNGFCNPGERLGGIQRIN